jgi:hypothetical protein
MHANQLRKSFSWRSFMLTAVFSIILFGVVAGFYWRTQGMGPYPSMRLYLLMFGFLFLFGILQWMFLKNSLAKLLAAEAGVEPMSKKGPPPSDAPSPDRDRKHRKLREQRLFVHLLAVLQREGRLIDFLKEDLSAYADDQIGAAVRSIHAQCSQTMERYLKPQPVIGQTEGERVEIPDGFDQNAVKLVGNVVGQPPFTGILRHGGWQVKAIALPKLSESENPTVIAPAEVEIQ